MTMWGIFFWPVGKFSFTIEAKKLIFCGGGGGREQTQRLRVENDPRRNDDG